MNLNSALKATATLLLIVIAVAGIMFLAVQFPGVFFVILAVICVGFIWMTLYYGFKDDRLL